MFEQPVVGGSVSFLAQFPGWCGSLYGSIQPKPE
jgi:hypothetical protein